MIGVTNTVRGEIVEPPLAHAVRGELVEPFASDVSIDSNCLKRQEF